MSQKHCWHRMGYGTSYGTGGSESGVCCYCGAHDVITYTIQQQPVPGHGPYATRNVRVDVFPEGECPKHPENA